MKSQYVTSGKHKQQQRESAHWHWHTHTHTPTTTTTDVRFYWQQHMHVYNNNTISTLKCDNNNNNNNNNCVWVTTTTTMLNSKQTNKQPKHKESTQATAKCVWRCATKGIRKKRRAFQRNELQFIAPVCACPPHTHKWLRRCVRARFRYLFRCRCC